MVKLKNKKRRLVLEILLILIISLFISLVYNAVSPSGVDLHPKKKPKSETSLKMHPQFYFIQSPEFLLNG